MIYRETGQYKTTYEADQQLLPILQDRLFMLIVLFVTQLFFTQEWIRYLFSGLYLISAVILLLTSKVRRQMLWSALLLKRHG